MRQTNEQNLAMHGNLSSAPPPPSSSAYAEQVQIGGNKICRPIAWQVRRAEAYIETHWDQPITIRTLARATAASSRSIFQHFKSNRGKSPMSFVKQVRLRHAKEMLEHADAARSVTQTAIACGFGNLGHFASDYFKCFGERPSDTLKRGKGQLEMW
jgi:transcriptional regulator GlxA family with amidase domain